MPENRLVGAKKELRQWGVLLVYEVNYVKTVEGWGTIGVEEGTGLYSD